jgi:HrpA-like RNA helicase
VLIIINCTHLLSLTAGKAFDVAEHYRPFIEEEEYSDEDGSEDGSVLSCSDDIYEKAYNPFRAISIANIEKTLVQHATSILFDDIIRTDQVQGDVLIFFSGSREIWKCVELINNRARDQGHAVVAYPLYSSMDEESKNAAKDPHHRTGLDNEKEWETAYVRKVICCTNIAEVCSRFYSCIDVYFFCC